MDCMQRATAHPMPIIVTVAFTRPAPNLSWRNDTGASYRFTMDAMPANRTLTKNTIPMICPPAMPLKTLTM